MSVLISLKNKKTEMPFMYFIVLNLSKTGGNYSLCYLTSKWKGLLAHKSFNSLIKKDCKVNTYQSTTNISVLNYTYIINRKLKKDKKISLIFSWIFRAIKIFLTKKYNRYINLMIKKGLKISPFQMHLYFHNNTWFARILIDRHL